MLKRAVSARQEIIDKIAAVVQARMTGAKAESAEDFVRHFYGDVSVDDVAETEIDDLYGAALSLWSFGAKRQPGETLVRTFTPRFEEHGWHSTHSVIEIVNDDMPFLVDSVTMELNRLNLTVHLIIHPTYQVARDEDGKASGFSVPDASKARKPTESFMHVEIDEITSPDALAEIEDSVRRVLEDVRASVEDWPKMRDQVQDIIDELRRNPPKRPRTRSKRPSRSCNGCMTTTSPSLVSGRTSSPAGAKAPRSRSSPIPGWASCAIPKRRCSRVCAIWARCRRKSSISCASRI